MMDEKRNQPCPPHLRPLPPWHISELRKETGTETEPETIESTSKSAVLIHLDVRVEACLPGMGMPRGMMGFRGMSGVDYLLLSKV